MIPKKLHFTFLTCDLPENYLDNLKRWQENCPDWELCFYTDEEIYQFFQDHSKWHFKNLEICSKPLLLRKVS